MGRGNATRWFGGLASGFALSAAMLVGLSGWSWAADPVSAAAEKEASEIWSSRCFTCHGMTGKGDGPAGAALDPKPRDFSNADWQKSVTDAAIDKIIVEGGAAVGKSVLMPPNPDLASKPEVVKALQIKIRGLAGK